MSYTEEVYERVVAQNPGEPEFHQAVKEVLDSLKVVIDKNEEEYRKLSILERLVEPERQLNCTGQQRLPCSVQQCDPAIPGRLKIPSFRKPGYPEISWL